MHAAGEAYDAVIAASQIKDPKQSIAAIEKVEAAVSDGEFGTFAALLLPSLSRVFIARNEAKELFQERRALLQRIADGEVEPWESATRPWLWILAARRAAQSDTPWWTDAQVAGEVDLLLLHAMAGQGQPVSQALGRSRCAGAVVVAGAVEFASRTVCSSH